MTSINGVSPANSSSKWSSGLVLYFESNFRIGRECSFAEIPFYGAVTIAGPRLGDVPGEAYILHSLSEDLAALHNTNTDLPN